MKIDLAQLEFINPLLRKIVIAEEKQFHDEWVITSLYRINDSGVHGQLPLRGIDVRCTDSEKGKYIEDSVNSRWSYDPNRPWMKVCMFHDVGQGEHLHFQVHHNTKEIVQ